MAARVNERLGTWKIPSTRPGCCKHFKNANYYYYNYYSTITSLLRPYSHSATHRDEKNAPFHLFVCYHLACSSSSKGLYLVRWTILPALSALSSYLAQAHLQEALMGHLSPQTRPLHWLPRHLSLLLLWWSVHPHPQRPSNGLGVWAGVLSSLLAHPVPTNTHPTCQQLSSFHPSFFSSPTSNEFPAPRIPFLLEKFIVLLETCPSIFHCLSIQSAFLGFKIFSSSI